MPRFRPPPKVYRYIFGFNAESCWKANTRHRHTTRAIMFTMSLNKPGFRDFKAYTYDLLLRQLAALIDSHGCGHSGELTEVEEAGEETSWRETHGIGSYIIHYRGDEMFVSKDIIRRRPFWK